MPGRGTFYSGIGGQVGRMQAEQCWRCLQHGNAAVLLPVGQLCHSPREQTRLHHMTTPTCAGRLHAGRSPQPWRRAHHCAAQHGGGRSGLPHHARPGAGRGGGDQQVRWIGWLGAGGALVQVPASSAACVAQSWVGRGSGQRAGPGKFVGGAHGGGSSGTHVPCKASEGT